MFIGKIRIDVFDRAKLDFFVGSTVADHLLRRCIGSPPWEAAMDWLRRPMRSSGTESGLGVGLRIRDDRCRSIGTSTRCPR